VAKPIEFEVTLQGEDARAFHEYMESAHGHSTPEGRDLMREAMELSKRIDRLFV